MEYAGAPEPQTSTTIERKDTVDAAARGLRPYYVRGVADTNQQNFDPGFPILGVWIANFTTVTVDMLFDRGEIIPIPAGANGCFINPPTTKIGLKPEATGTGVFCMQGYAKQPVPVLVIGNEAGGGGAGGNVTIAGPLGQAVMAASIPVVIASNQSAVPVTSNGPFDAGDTVAVGTTPREALYGWNGVTWERLKSGAALVGMGSTVGVLGAALMGRDSATGNPTWALFPDGDSLSNATGLGVLPVFYDPAATNLKRTRGDPANFAPFVEDLASATFNAGQVAMNGATQVSIITANIKRKGVLVKNMDATITVTIGGASVSTSNGMPLKPGESMNFRTQSQIYGVSASGTPSVAFWEDTA